MRPTIQIRFESRDPAIRLYHAMIDYPIPGTELNIQRNTLYSRDMTLMEVLKEIAQERRIPYEIIIRQ